MILEKEFFKKPAYEVAPMLIGKILCRKDGDKVIRARITETECYYGFDDSASHAHKGMTERNSIMFDEGGRTYIYLCYGIHNLLNITTGAEGHPEAVLIRGVEGAQGPGRVTKHMNIGRELNKISVCGDGDIWVEDDRYESKITTDKRVGIDYAAQKDRNALWRFIDSELYDRKSSNKKQG